MLYYQRLLAVFSLAVLLAACGGGGSGTTASAPVVATTPTLGNAVGPGQFVNAVQLKTIAPADIRSALAQDGDTAFLASPTYTVQAWRLTYLTVDGQGRQVSATGLVALPQKPANALSPVLSYQHATIKRQADAPTSLTKLGDPPVVLASLGYIVEAADYVGYGGSVGALHPYLLSAPSASAVIDFLTAAKFWRQTQQVADNKQLFMTGYSEGGYVTMAAHRALQAGTTTHRNELVRVVTGDGPYDVGTTLDQQLAVVKQNNPLLAQLFNPGLLRFLSDSNRRILGDLLLAALLGVNTEVIFMPTVIDNYLADNRAAIESASNVFDWAPQVPVSLIHGRDDITVSYLNATNALQAMRARGAGSLVTLTDCVATPADHSGCILPYWRLVLDQFGKAAKDL